MSAVRRLVAFAAALAVLVVAPFLPGRTAPVDRRPSIVVILTDDQSFDSLPHDPPVMPALQAMLEDPNDHWATFANAFISTPLCCPSRATILTGRYSHHTGVQTNHDGGLFDETSTVATWLHDSGYRTGLLGKYLNGYPFGSPYVPPGWDGWLGKEQGEQGAAYYDYVVVDQGFPVSHGDRPQDYTTDVYAAAAEDFIRSSPADQPLFLMVTPNAPHPPWMPAPGDAGAYAGMTVTEPPSVGEEDVSDKPEWVRALPPFDAARRILVHDERRRSFETLRAVDRMVAGVIQVLRETGRLENTIVFFLTDNGMSFGEHRWVGKTCPYEECIRTPFAVRYPWAPSRTDDHLVSNIDLAPTIAELAGIAPGGPVDGRSFVPLLDPAREADTPWRTALLLEYVGDRHIPGWTAIRTPDFLYVEYESGEREVYDLSGRLLGADPFELENRLTNPVYAPLLDDLAAELAKLRGG